MRDNKILYNYNRIHAYMQRVGDGGGIYTLSNQTPSDIRGNYVFDLRRSPNGDPSCMIYLDKGSSEGPPKLKSTGQRWRRRSGARFS
jgi:hypothetical protein